MKEDIIMDLEDVKSKLLQILWSHTMTDSAKLAIENLYAEMCDIALRIHKMAKPYDHEIKSGRKQAQAELWTDQDMFKAWELGVLAPSDLKFEDWLKELKEFKRKTIPD